MSLAFLDDERFAVMLAAADGDMDRLIKEMTPSGFPEVSAASSPTQSSTPAPAPFSNVQEEVVLSPPPALASGRVTSSPVPHKRHALGAAAGAALHGDPIAPAGAAIIGSLPSTEPVRPRFMLREPSLRLCVTDATVVDPSVADPLRDALLVVEDLSSMYLELGAATAPLSILHTALEAAVAYCDDAIGGPSADLSPLGDVPIGKALKFLAGVSNMYRKYGSKHMPVPIVREALVRAMVQCK
mmetsp:Transcript_3522/g.5152  ORF Transcript_3522/g.5152 Transcript_3522/m.5152 type:complete len:242 (-) Transcript_3522:112-837(-)